MPTKKERLDALEADMRELREELDLVNERLNERTNGLGAKLHELTAAFTLHNNAVVDGQAALDRQMADLRLVIEDHNRRISDNKNLDEINRQLVESFRRIHARLSALESTTVGSTIFGLQPNPPGFPTGAATTVNDALAAAPAADAGNKVWSGQERDSGSPSVPWQLDTTNPRYMPPRRGDRVRLEGARSLGGRRVPDGWHDVIGHDTDGLIAVFQVVTSESTERDDLTPWKPWVTIDDAGLKEIRRNVAHPTDVDEKDLDV